MVKLNNNRMCAKHIVASLVLVFSALLSNPALAEDSTSPAAVPATPAIVDTATGGPYIDAAARIQALGGGDTQFRSAFSAWTEMDRGEAAVAIPSRKPIDKMTLSSDFGTRSDPFSGRRARHNGIDIPAPRGTPIFATADGVIGRAQWVSGYGNYVEINHGANIQTRYGHMSGYSVVSGQRIRKGDVIGYVGSTGRSTGNHLHYEVRLSGVPVNPLNFVQSPETLVALRSGSQMQVAVAPESKSTAQGGPAAK